MGELAGWNYSDVFEALVAGNLPPGTDLGGRYEVGELLGKGGVGLVYRATDHMLGEEVVLKILNPTLASDPDTVKRFKREIKICRKIAHPNVIRIYDIDEIYGTLFISMELVSGTNLKTLIRHRGRVGEAEGWELLRGMVQGLAAAHQMGVVHRDLKSQNVMVDADGHVKILDFGMARLLGMDHLTRGGDILGSPPYMSPEQAQGLEVDHRTDIYSLGIILFEMFTGQLPFLGETPLATVLLQIDREPPRPSSIHPQIPPELERLILTCLRKKPQDRFQGVEELLTLQPRAGASRGQKVVCAHCGEENPAAFRHCKACGQGMDEPRQPEQRWYERGPETRLIGESFAACLVGAVASCLETPLPTELRRMLQLAASVGQGTGVAEFRRSAAKSVHAEEAAGGGHGGELLALVLGLRHFTNRGKMRAALRELLSEARREELMMGYLVGEVLSLLARQRCREASEAVTLRSLAGMLRVRLGKAFASEPWLLLSLDVVAVPVAEPLGSEAFERLYSGQPALLALHLLFGTAVSAPGGLGELLGLLEGGKSGRSAPWRRISAALVAGLWAFWHGVEAIPYGLLRRQPACALAYDLGRGLHEAA